MEMLRQKLCVTFDDGRLQPILCLWLTNINVSFWYYFYGKTGSLFSSFCLSGKRLHLLQFRRWPPLLPWVKLTWPYFNPYPPTAMEIYHCSHYQWNTPSSVSLWIARACVCLSIVTAPQHAPDQTRPNNRLYVVKRFDNIKNNFFTL